MDANGNKTPIGQNNGVVGTKRTPINWGNKFNDFVGGLS